MTLFSGFGKVGVLSGATAASPADYHWDDVVLLMDYDGNLTDTSPIGRTMTAVTGGATTGGSAAISTAQKKFGTHSLAIEGPDAGAAATRVGGHLTTPHHANLLFGSGDFTIEAFIRLNVLAAGAVQDNGSVGGGYNMIASHIYFPASGTRLGWEWNVNLSNVLSFRANITSWGLVGDGSTALSADTWYHVAVCREGTKVRQFLNGALEHEATVSGSMAVPSPERTLKIGRYELHNGSFDVRRHFDGYMDSFRITKAARYTTNFTIPTAQYPTGTASASVDQHWGNVKLLIQAAGSDTSTSFTDASATGRTITTVGNAQVDTAQTATSGRSILFDGTGDYLTAPNSADFNFGAGDFTIEAWVRLNAIGQFNEIANQDANSLRGWQYGITSGNKLRLYGFISTWQELGISTTSLAADRWYHCAVTREGTSFRIFLDGVLEDTTVVSGAIVDENSNLLEVGHNILNTGAHRYMNGWIDNVRITKGVARYTSNFTVPTAQYPTGS